MTILWWTLYILGALTAIITWFNVMMLLGRLFKIIHDKEWMQVKVIEGPPGPKGDRGERGPEGPRGLVGASGSFVFSSDAKRTIKEFMAEQGLLNRKDTESLIRMEVAAQLTRLNLATNRGDWPKNQSKVDVDKLIAEYRESKADK